MPARTKSRSTQASVKIGRPTKFSPEWAETFCREISQGHSVAEICERRDQPSQQSVYSWLREDGDFLERYARAREEQADKLFKECLEIADKATPENASVARLQVDTRKWAAARLAPKKYGDHISHDVRGSTTLNYQPAILIKVGDGTTTRSEDAPAPKAGRGVLLNGNGDIVRER